jgi:chromosome segregation ATPase
MAIPALKLELEEPVEDRVGKLEAHVEHIRADVSESKIEIRRLNDKVDEVKDSLAKFALSVEKSFAELKIGRALDRVWWLLICGTLLGVMARGFKWI